MSTPEHPDDVPFDMRDLRHVPLKDLPDLPELVAAARIIADAQGMAVETWAWDELRRLAVTLQPGADVTAERLADLAVFCTSNGLGRPRGGPESGEFEVPLAERTKRPPAS